ncbi:hypothetical protein D3C84_1181290 [compost metagenome]
MAGVRLGVIHIRLVFEPAYLRQAVGTDADHPAPLIIDLYPTQLREHLKHFRPHISADVRRVAA